jgi:hypothetical protein
VDTPLADQEVVYAPRQGNDRLLLGPEEVSQRVRARPAAAEVITYPVLEGRDKLIVAAPVGFIKVGDRLEKDPDRHVQAAITLTINEVA